MDRTPRYYVDTSVVGGCLDPEFMEDSQRLFHGVRKGRARIVVSPLLLVELSHAPAAVQDVLSSVPPRAMEVVELGEESESLRDAYLAAGAISAKWSEDAWHVALATIARADLIVSWNFRHLVNVARIRSFNAVNLRLGYPLIDIRSPKELPHDEDE